MRFLVILVGLLALAEPALGKPKVAVAPFKGDKNNKVADAIAEALAGSVKVTDPKATGKVIEKLNLGKELDADEAKRLHKKLEVDAVVQGKLDKDDGKQTLKVAIFLKGKDEAVRFTVQFTKVNDKFREDVSGLIVKKLDTDKPRRLTDGEGRSEGTADKDKDKKKRRIADDDPPDGETKVRKKRKKKRGGGDDEVEGPRKIAARVDLGAFGGVRRLTYSSGMAGPPPVGTRTLAAHLEGEIYPFAFGNQTGGMAGLGLAGEFEKTLGLAIQIPGGGTTPINQGHFSIGGRYRFAVGAKTSVIAGADFSKRHYIADRSSLAAPTDLDAPDVDYTAVVPNAGFSTMVAPTVALWARASGMLFLDTGPIQKGTSFGAAKVFGFGARLGTDVAFSQRLGLRISGEFEQISFKFDGSGEMAAARGVTAAADRRFGLAAMLGVTY